MMIKKILEVPTLQEKTYECIRDMIVQGEIPVGNRIKEDNLAKMLGSSRVPVRESLIRLRAEGLLEKKVRCGFSVKEYTPKEVIELYKLREVIEGLAARLAAENVTMSQMSECWKFHEEYKKVVTDLCKFKCVQGKEAETLFEKMTSIDEQLHWFIMSISGNSKIEEVASFLDLQRKLCLNIKVLRGKRKIFCKESTKLSIVTHERILSAIEKHNPSQAEEEMRSHISGGLDAILRNIE